MDALAVKLRKVGIAWLVGLVAFGLAGQVGYGAVLHEGGHKAATFSRAAQPNTHTEEARKALDWMRSQQQPDGSFPGFGAGSTVDAVLAIIAAGMDPDDSFIKNGRNPVDFLETKAKEIAATPGGAGKLLIVVATLKEDFRSFGGVNLLEAIGSNYPSEGHYGKDAIGHAFAMLGLYAAGQPIPPKAVDYLKSAQTPEGGWAFSGDTKAGGADTNTTAVVVQALVAAGVSETDPMLEKAGEYLLSQENASDGGFPYQQGGEFGSDSDVNSTAYVSQALRYLGERRGIGFILSMQKPNGAFRWMASEQDDNPGATYQAIPAILGATLVEPKGALAQIERPTGSITPGMPTTGGGDALPVLAGIAGLALAALGAGAMMRRRTAR